MNRIEILNYANINYIKYNNDFIAFVMPRELKVYFFKGHALFQ